MRSRNLKCVLLVLFVSIVFSGKNQAQEGTSKPASPQEAPARKSAPDIKSALMGASRGSTAKATESASCQKAEGEQAEKGRAQTDDSAVTELRSLPPDQQNQALDSMGGSEKKKSKAGQLKNFHGTVYGGSGSASRAAGASVGGSTRSGRTSVYVEGQSTRTRQPRQ